MINCILGPEDGLRNHEYVSVDCSSPILECSLPRIEPRTPISKCRGNPQIFSQKTPLQDGDLFLSTWTRTMPCRHSKYYICPAPFHQPLYCPQRLGYYTLALQGTLRPQLSKSEKLWCEENLRVQTDRQTDRQAEPSLNQSSTNPGDDNVLKYNFSLKRQIYLLIYL